MEKSTILNKIKLFYGFKKDSEFARYLGISPQTFLNWKKRNSYDSLLIHTKCPEINLEWLLTSEGPMIKRYISDKDIPLSVREHPAFKLQEKNNFTIPVYNLDTNGGLKNIVHSKSKDTFISEFIKIPNLSDCDGAIYIKGESMFPLLKNGDMVIFKNASTENLFWGELYIIEIALTPYSNHTFVRHIQKSSLGKDHIKLVSANPMYESKDVSLNTINAIGIIRASIRFH
ncbi:MAG: LexA family transcriptional regulator [Apibacter sp.]|jgi:phage repressor protein C with HTH and peptisase S24 domain|uniref:Bacteriophage CI repressor helix-turn-helix domain-containing protein n=1 Tax=Apibacter mensalis TaxID=1586267 RepID=A0A0X3ANQ7_9FLAO|nr:LexA family transcriptional regulator [Apibacter mensalis]MCO6564084.1 LexA family transcriptional regulator [Apibacter sp.]CVK15787.1 Bacteriophage CI repressor helix-turn-helix domain-containing protein [Apibacter mensalis]